METGFIAFGVFVPGVVDIFFDFLRRVGVYRMNLAQVAVEDDAARTHVIFYTGVSMQGKITVGKVIAYAAAYLAPFVFIYAGNHQEVGNIHLVDEMFLGHGDSCWARRAAAFGSALRPETMSTQSRACNW